MTRHESGRARDGLPGSGRACTVPGMISLRLTAFVVFASWIAGCPASHDPTADAGSVGTDAPVVGTDAPILGTDAPVVWPDVPLPLACDGPSGCTLRPASCCGSCGVATPTDMIALPDDQVSAYVDVVCEDVGCPECAGMPDPYLLATCQAGTCTAVDLHAHPLTACDEASDCQLAPSECCGCGLRTAEGSIAFNPAGGSLGTLYCDPDADCPPCVPDFSMVAAECVSGRCVVVAVAP